MEGLAGRIVLLFGWRRRLVAFLAGVVAALGQAPFDFPAACFVAFPVLVWLLDGAVPPAPARLAGRLRSGFSVGWWFGFGYFLFGLWWVGGALLVEAESFAWALPLAVLILPAGLALFYGLATALARPFWGEGIFRIVALAAGFGAAEWLRARLFTGFPWNEIGYAAMPAPLLMQSVVLVGMTGMTVLAVLVFAMPALAASRRHRVAGAAIAVALLAAHVGFGAFRLSAPPAASGEPLRVRIVQPDADMGEKWDPGVRDRLFKDLLDLSTAPPQAGQPAPQVVVWPETSVPFVLTEQPEALAAIGEALSDGQVLLAGVVRSEGDGRSQAGALYYNSVVMIDDGGQIVGAVDKVHMVPFGEYLPLAGLFAAVGLEQLVAGPMNFTAGSARQDLALPGGRKAAVFVCYEVIFTQLVNVDARLADLIVNVTNDGWFGDTPGPYQHFRQAQVRAVETGLPLLRAANTGISGIVDGRGRVEDALAIDVRGVVDATLPQGRDAFGRIGDPNATGHAVLGLMVVVALLGGVRRRY